MDMASGIGDSNLRAEAQEKVVEYWFRNDPDAAIQWMQSLPEGRRKFFSVKVAGDFPEGGRVCGFRFFGLGEGEVGFASFPGFGDFGEDARDESQE